MENELEKWKENKINFYLERYNEYLESDTLKQNYLFNILNMEGVQKYYKEKVENNINNLLSRVKNLIGSITNIKLVKENIYQFENENCFCTAKAVNVSDRYTKWIISLKD